jgi:hypothetical protein
LGLADRQDMMCRKIFLVRAKKPFVQFCDFTITNKHREYFTKVAAQVWQMVQAAAYVPVTDTWFCKPGWCNYYAGCQGEF